MAPIGGAIELSLPAVERTAAELLKATQTELGKVPGKVVGRWVQFVTLARQKPLASVPRGKAQLARELLPASIEDQLHVIRAFAWISGEALPTCSRSESSP